MSNTDRSEPLRSVYDAKSSEEAVELYDSWAEDYERSVLAYGYAVPTVVAEFFGRYVKPEDGTVLDDGAGTGIIGEILAPLGYHDMIGIDLSFNMLELARKKGVYKDLRQMELGVQLDLPSDSFTAIVSAGVFAAGHAPPESFEELIRATKPGGYMIFSVRTDVCVDGGGFKEKQEALERENRWQLLEMTEMPDPFARPRFEDPELKVQVFAYQVR